MHEMENEHDARVCEWCAKSIPQQAIKCPHCGGWRKDIYMDRISFYLSLALTWISLLGLIVGYRQGWWHKVSWHPTGWKTGPWSILPGEFSVPSFEFSFEAFLASFSGIIILIGIILGVLLSLIYGVKLSRKIGSLW